MVCSPQTAENMKEEGEVNDVRMLVNAGAQAPAWAPFFRKLSRDRIQYNLHPFSAFGERAQILLLSLSCRAFDPEIDII